GRLGHLHDVREPREGGGGLVRAHVGAFAQADHDLGEAEDVLGVDAELAGGFRYLRDALGGRGYLAGHVANAALEARELFLGGVDGLPDAREGALEGDAARERGGAQPDDGGGDVSGEGTPSVRERLLHALQA